MRFWMIASLLLCACAPAPDSSDAGFDPGPADGGAGGAADGGFAVRTFPGLPEAIDAAVGWLVANASDPSALLAEDVLARRFAVREFDAAAAAYDVALAVNDTPELRVYRRIFDPAHTIDPADLDALGAEVDRITGPALYCDRIALPADYSTRLTTAVIDGGYGVTHVAFALGWMDENGCAPVGPVSLRDDTLAGNAALTEPAAVRDDLALEAALMLAYLGEGRRVTDSFLEGVIADQRSDGAWPLTPAASQPHWHPTVIAAWLLLEVSEVPLGPVVAQF